MFFCTFFSFFLIELWDLLFIPSLKANKSNKSFYFFAKANNQNSFFFWPNYWSSRRKKIAARKNVLIYSHFLVSKTEFWVCAIILIRRAQLICLCIYVLIVRFSQPFVTKISGENLIKNTYLCFSILLK